MSLDNIQPTSYTKGKSISAISDNISEIMNTSYCNAVDFADKGELISGLVWLENETWPEWTRAVREAFESRINIFPEWVFFHQEGMDFWGLSTSLITQITDPNTIDSWEDITDYGMIRSHNPLWNALYVVSVGVSPRFQWKGIGRELVTYQIALAKKLWLQHIVLGSRVPAFHAFDGNIEEYLSLEDDTWKSVDPLVRFYQWCGLEIGKIKSNYMEDDKESRNYGVIMYKNLINDTRTSPNSFIEQ